MSLRRYTFLLALAVLLITTIPSPAAVTVLPEATPTPASKHEKTKPAHPSESFDPKKIAGTWRGHSTGTFEFTANGTRFRNEFGNDEQFTFSNELRTVERTWIAEYVLKDGKVVDRTNWKGVGPSLPMAVQREGDTLIAKQTTPFGNGHQEETWIFHLQDQGSLRVEYRENVRNPDAKYFEQKRTTATLHR